MTCHLQVGLEELWDRQHQLAAILNMAGVVPLLKGLADSSPRSLAQRWAQPPMAASDLHSCPKVDAIKVSLCFLCLWRHCQFGLSDKVQRGLGLRLSRMPEACNASKES